MARELLGNLLYPSQTEEDGGCVCVWECETDRCMGRAAGGVVYGVLGGMDLLRAYFHSAKVWEKKTTNEKLHPAQLLHHNDPHNVVHEQDCATYQITLRMNTVPFTFQGTTDLIRNNMLVNI